MKLDEFARRHFNSRQECAKHLGISYQQLNNMISSGREVRQLKSGEWITVNHYTKYITINKDKA